MYVTLNRWIEGGKRSEQERRMAVIDDINFNLFRLHAIALKPYVENMSQKAELL